MDPSPPSVPASVVILGAGTMGTGIGITFAKAGARVAMTARRRATLDRARRGLDESLALLARHGSIPEEAVDLVSERVTMQPFQHLDLEVDLVIESIAEDAAAKVDILCRAESGALPTTILTTNTSSLSISELSGALARPENFAGFHWFNPAELMSLVEVIPGPNTRPSTISSLVSWSVGAGKDPVTVNKEIDGFIANRLQYALMREAYDLVEGGVCALEDVDLVMRVCLGPRWSGIGPFEAMDLAGLDVHLAVARRLFPLLSNRSRVPPFLETLVASGALGTKSGRGLHGRYEKRAIAALRERRFDALIALSELERRASRERV